MRILILYSNHEAPAIQDIYFNNPLRILEKEAGIRFTIQPLAKFRFESIFEYNIIVVSRIFEEEVLDIINYCNANSKKILFFFDDDILNFPEEYYLGNEHYYQDRYDHIQQILCAADALIVSTEKLKTSYAAYNAKIYVVGPSYDTELIDNIYTRKTGTWNDEFVIGYAGSFGHVIDFKFMEKALFDFWQQNKGKVRVEFMGCIPDIFTEKTGAQSAKLIHWQPDYEKYLKNLGNAGWSLALAPVIESEYTSHKTNIKFIEYSAFRIPGIYSRINIYEQDIENGINGYLAANDYNSWYEQLQKAFLERDALSNVAIQAFETVREKHSGKQAAIKWKTLLEEYKYAVNLSSQAAIFWAKTQRVYRQKGGLELGKKILFKIRQRLHYSPVLDGAQSAQASPGHKQIQELSRRFDKKIIRKQLLFIVPWLEVGGGDRVNLLIAQSLDKEEYDLHFITTEKSRHEWHKKFKGITPHIFHLRNSLPETEFFWEYNQLILEYIKEAQIDLIILSNSSIGYTCLPAIREKFPHIRVIDILHGQGGKNEGGGFPAFSLPYAGYLDKRVTINNYLVDYMCHKYQLEKSSFTIIHNGVDTDHFKPIGSASREPFTVSFIGRLSAEKNPGIFIDIASRVVEDPGSHSIEFRIVGDGPQRIEIERRIFVRKLSKKIRVEGFSHQVKQVLEETSVLILCSEMEGLPMVILEAMAMGIPVIASNVGGVPELVINGQTGFLIDIHASDRVEQFSAAVNKLSSDRKMYEEMSRAALDYVRSQFSISRMTQAYQSLLKEVCL